MSFEELAVRTNISELKQVFSFYEYIVFRINAIGYVVFLHYEGYSICDYYFINTDNKEQNKFIGSNVKLGDLYKVVDKNKNIYEYILNYKKSSLLKNLGKYMIYKAIPI